MQGVPYILVYEVQDDDTDIVMLITPHIVRDHDLTKEDVGSIFIGTQGNISLSGPPQLIAPQPEPAPAPAPPPPQTGAASVTPGGVPGPPVGSPGGVQPTNPSPPSGTQPVPGAPGATQLMAEHLLGTEHVLAGLLPG